MQPIRFGKPTPTKAQLASTSVLWTLQGGKSPVTRCACSGAVVNGACLRCKRKAEVAAPTETKLVNLLVNPTVIA